MFKYLNSYKQVASMIFLGLIDDSLAQDRNLFKELFPVNFPYETDDYDKKGIYCKIVILIQDIILIKLLVDR
jgi:hypothetical protein